MKIKHLTFLALALAAGNAVPFLHKKRNHFFPNSRVWCLILFVKVYQKMRLQRWIH